MPQLNNDSFKEISKVTNKNYYLRLDDKNRLTLELTEDKTLVECVGITLNTIQALETMPTPDGGWLQIQPEFKYTPLAKTIEQVHKDADGEVK